MVLVDTSIWIEFLRGVESKHVQHLEKLIELGEVAINEVIYNEICIGAKGIQQFKKYETYFGAIPLLFLKDWHTGVAKLRFSLRTKGFTTFLADTLIAYSALENKIPLMTTDKDFKPFATHCGLKLYL